MVEVLERGGIAFGPERVPEDITLMPLSVTRDRDSEADVARTLLGEVTREGEGEVRRRYVGSGGTAEFSMNGAFRVELAPGVWSRAAGQSYEDACQDCLEQIGFSGELEQGGEESGVDTAVLTYCQSWEGALVFSCQVTLTWQGEDLRSIDGYRLAGTATAREEADLLSTPTILLRFLTAVTESGDVSSRIDAMEPGYLTSGTARPVQLTPVWRITTDTGVYYMDAVAGELLTDL